MGAFRLGINMAGAVSAGAYTAGVLDFLVQALDEWHTAKERGDAVPMHELSLDVFSGASAGGMCAAIASVMMQSEFAHVTRMDAENTNNPLYESWVNRIDIRKLLNTDDLEEGKPVVSLLDCSIIDEIARDALVAGKPKGRKYVSPQLTLFLTLTNLTGIPYSLNSMGAGSLEECTLYHPDRLRFETVRAQAGGGIPQTTTPTAKALPLGRPDHPGWDLLRETAKATGAFPIFLAPRMIERDKADYDVPMWLSVNPEANKDKATITPMWPDDSRTFRALYVDGGVMNNDPFNLAHDYIASLSQGSRQSNQNPREPQKANAAVITVAPFPTKATLKAEPQYEKAAAVAAALGSLASAVIEQSRFFGESLALIVKGASSSRFVIAPSDLETAPETPALQCAALGAFGGFFERKFRAHDYLLGRRNCQRFLQRHFALPLGNPIIDAGLAAAGGKKEETLKRFRIDPPAGVENPASRDWIPIIPLCSDAVAKEAARPERQKMGDAAIEEVVTLIYERAGKVAGELENAIPNGFIRGLAGVATHLTVLLGLGKKEFTEYLRSQLQ